MLKFAGNDFGNGIAGRYIVTYDFYGKTVLYDQKTQKEYVYDHWKLEKCTTEGYITVTVFLAEKKNPDDLPDFNSPEAFFCEPD
jgi:hypothetical protein